MTPNSTPGFREGVEAAAKVADGFVVVPEELSFDDLQAIGAVGMEAYRQQEYWEAIIERIWTFALKRIAGATTALPTLPAQPADEPVLDEPARIGTTVFGAGVKYSTVIGRAQREYKEQIKRLNRMTDTEINRALSAQPAGDVERVDKIVAKLRDSATFISDTVLLDATGGWSNLRHAAADMIEALLAARAEERAAVVEFIGEWRDNMSQSMKRGYLTSIIAAIERGDHLA